MRRRWWIWLGIVVVIVVAGYSVWGRGDTTPEVSVEKVKRRDIIAHITESGTVVPAVEVPVAPDVSGEVIAIYVKEGDYVKEGQLLLTIKPEHYQAAYEQALAALNSAKAEYANAKAQLAQSRYRLMQDSLNYQRNLQLYEKQAISKAELEQAQFQYQLAQAQFEAAQQQVQSAFYRVKSAYASLKQARENLQKTRLYASMNGVITKLNVEKGQRVVGTGQMQGTEVLKIADLREMWVEIEVSEKDIVNIRLGNRAKIFIDAFPRDTFTGEVVEIAYSPEQANVATGATSVEEITSYPVKVRILPESYRHLMEGLAPYESPFRPGMSALVTIYTDTAKQAVAVPLQALTLLPKTEQEGVFVLKGNKVEARKVERGISDERYAEIKKGVKEGEKVVTGPYKVLTKVLRDGMEVQVKRRERFSKRRRWKK